MLLLAPVYNLRFRKELYDFEDYDLVTVQIKYAMQWPESHITPFNTAHLYYFCSQC